jgi:putative flippase GtrA
MAITEPARPFAVNRGGLARLLTSRPLLFIAFGGTAALANLAAGWLLYGSGLAPGLPYWCATAIAAGVGLVVNFGLNHSFNFRFRHRPAWQQFGTFCAVSGVGVALTSGLASGLRSLLLATAGHPPAAAHREFAAHFLAVGLVALYSYPAHRFLSFNIGVRARLHQARLLLAGAK